MGHHGVVENLPVNPDRELSTASNHVVSDNSIYGFLEDKIPFLEVYTRFVATFPPRVV